MTERKKYMAFHVGWRIVLMILLFGGLNAIGYGITRIIYRYTGEPSDLAAHILSGVTSLSLFAILSLFFQFVISRSDAVDRHRRGHNKLTDALDQIAKGNFNVLIDPSEDRFHHELVDAVNDMAKKLGSMETMRQDFISNVSHEIQSPLTSIGGFAVLLKDKGLSQEQREHYATIIETESRRLSSLSDNLLKLSVLDGDKKPLSKEAFRLDKQLEGILLTMEPQWADKNITPEADLQKCILEGDRDLLSQAWVNLIHNAIKFTPINGEIMISLKEDKNQVIIKICDSGIGISKEEQIHIFERFYKVDKSRDRALGGNGLGLSLVKKIILLHNGSITVDSEPGYGTTFTIMLPLK